MTGAGAPDGIDFATARLLGAMGAAVGVAATSDRVQAAGWGRVVMVASVTGPAWHAR